MTTFFGSRTRLLIAGLVFAIVMIFAACSGPSGGPSSGGSGGTSGGTGSGGDGAPSQGEILLTAAGYVPPSYEDLHPPMQAFVDYVNEHGKGIVQIDYHHSGTLLAAGELLPGLLQGTVDIIFHTDSYLTGSLPILGAMELPYLFDSREGYIENTQRDTELYALINQELAKDNVFMLATTAGFIEHLWTVDRPIRSPDDLAGMRVRTAGLIEARFIEELGGSTTTLSSAELYEALDRGTIDAVMSYLGTIPSRSLQEIVRYVNDGIFGSYGENIFFRLDRWESLPEEAKAILIEAAEIFETEGNAHIMRVHDEQYWKEVQDAGVEIVRSTPEEEAAFREAARRVWDWWLEQVPADVGARVLEIAEEYRANQ